MNVIRLPRYERSGSSEYYDQHTHTHGCYACMQHEGTKRESFDECIAFGLGLASLVCYVYTTHPDTMRTRERMIPGPRGRARENVVVRLIGARGTPSGVLYARAPSRGRSLCVPMLCEEIVRASGVAPQFQTPHHDSAQPSVASVVVHTMMSIVLSMNSG